MLILQEAPAISLIGPTVDAVRIGRQIDAMVSLDDSWLWGDGMGVDDQAVAAARAFLRERPGFLRGAESLPTADGGITISLGSTLGGVEVVFHSGGCVEILDGMQPVPGSHTVQPSPSRAKNTPLAVMQF